MNTIQYRKNVYRTLQAAVGKAGIRATLRKKRTVNIGCAIIGFATAAGALRQSLLPYLTGESQLKDEMRDAARERFEGLFYNAAVLSRELKVKLPLSKKKVKLEGTLTTNILLLDGLATDLLTEYQNAYRGEPWDAERLVDRFKLAVPYLYGIVYSMFGESPEAIFASNIDRLMAANPEAFVDKPKPAKDPAKAPTKTVAAKAAAKKGPPKKAPQAAKAEDAKAAA